VAGSLLVGTVVVGTVVVGSLPASSAPTALSLYVSTTGSDGGGTNTCTASATPCLTIQQAINEAESSYSTSDDVTINVATGTYTENDSVAASSLNSLTIAGAGASTTTVNGNQKGSEFLVSAGTVTMSGLTMTDGGGQYCPGGIANYGTTTLTDSTVSGNTTSKICGGGIYNGGTMALTDSTVSGNTAPSGGGIYNVRTMTLTDSTVSGNTAIDGGGIYNEGTMTLTDSTVSGNTAIDGGVGGIDNVGSGPLNVGATIVAQSTSGGACSGTITDLGYNIDDDESCGFSGTAESNSSHLDASLGLLTTNGGPTQTILPTSTSPAVGIIPTGTTLNGVQVCPRTDQRGVASALGANCTIGAVEVPPSSQLRITTTSLPDGTVGQPYSFALQAVGGNPPYTWWYAKGGNLPRGVKFSTAGVLSGTTKKAGSYSITFRVRDTQIAGHHVNKAHTSLTVTITIT
jgi:hypothetical protein